MARKLKLVLTYRVLQHWRTPVFRRLATWPDIRFCALHGGDFPGTKAVNGKNLQGFRHRELATIRLDLSRGADPIPMPICPTLPFQLMRERPPGRTPSKALSGVRARTAVPGAASVTSKTCEQRFLFGNDRRERLSRVHPFHVIAKARPAVVY